MIQLVLSWIERCKKAIGSGGDASLLRREFPGFDDVFTAL